MFCFSRWPACASYRYSSYEFVLFLFANGHCQPSVRSALADFFLGELDGVLANDVYGISPMIQGSLVRYVGRAIVVGVPVGILTAVLYWRVFCPEKIYKCAEAFCRIGWLVFLPVVYGFFSDLVVMDPRLSVNISAGTG